MIREPSVCLWSRQFSTPFARYRLTNNKSYSATHRVCGKNPRRGDRSRAFKAFGRILAFLFPPAKSIRASAKCGRAFPGTTSSARRSRRHALDRLVSVNGRAVVPARRRCSRFGHVRGGTHLHSVHLFGRTDVLGGKGPVSRRRANPTAPSIGRPFLPLSAGAAGPLVADALETVSRGQIADLPDRIIAATALALHVPLVSRDAKIRAPHIHTIW